MAKKSKLKIKRLLIFSISILLLGGIFLRLTTPVVEAAWYDENYAYRTPVTFTHNANVTADTYVAITISNTNTLVTNNKMQSSCADSRFTDTGGKLLRYQLVSGCNSASTVYNVAIPANYITANNKVLLYFYYGNPAATSGSDSTVGSLTQTTPSGGAAASGSEQQGPGPVAYWRFDEGNGTTAYDANIANKNNGTLSGTTIPAWKSEDMCISGKCLFFDGSTSYITASNGNSIRITGPLTLSAWVRISSFAANRDIIARNGASGSFNYRLYANTSGNLVLEVSSNGTTTTTVTGTQVLATNTWYHLSGVYVPSTSLTIYVNGLQDGQNTTTIPASINNATSNLLIGAENAGATNNFLGFIDEPRIYNYARTANQIKNDFSTRSSIEPGTALGSSIENTNSTLSNGLLGYWKLDESSGNPVDSSGNSLTLTNNNTTTFSAGKFGSGSLHNGTSQYFSTATSVSNVRTVSFWVYPANNTNNYINLASGVYINSSSGTVSATGFTSPTIYVNGILNGTVTASAWNQIVVTTSTAITANTIELGRANGSYLTNTSLLDEVRFYNRSFNPANAAQIANWAAGPVFWLKFDENTGVAITNSGTTTATVDASSIPGNPWRPGKYGSALYTDGTSQSSYFTPTGYDEVTGPGNQSFSLSGWVYLTNGVIGSYWRNIGLMERDTSTGACSGRMFLGLRYTSDSNRQAQFMVPHQSGAPGCADNTSLESSDLNLNQWYYLAGTFDIVSKEMKLYLDGVVVGTTTWGGTGTLTWINDIYGLVDGTGSPIGTFDDFKWYNYTRTQSQVQQDMGAARAPGSGMTMNGPGLYYKLDDQTSTTAKNANTAQLTTTGAITTGTWLQPSSCKINTCLSLTAQASTISAGDTAFTDSLNAFNISVWLNPQTLTTDDTIVGKTNLSTQNSFLVRTDTSTASEIRVYIANGLTDSANYFTTSGLGLTASTWQHLDIIYDGSQPAASRVKVYKNGQPISGTVTGTIPTSMTSGSTSAFKIGDTDITGSEGLISYYDEFKFTPAAISQADILVDYNAGSSLALGNIAGTQNDEGFSLPAPAAWWRLDDNAGTTTTDSSGNSFTSSTFTGTPVWRTGKIGSGLYFDGTNSVVRIPEATATDKGALTDSYTVSAWFKTPPSYNYTAQANLVAKNNNGTSAYPYELFVDSTEIVCFDMAGTGSPNTCSAATYNDGNWHFATGVRDTTADKLYIYVDGVLQATPATDTTTATAVNNADISIGNGGNSYTQYDFTGVIDDVRIYNSALSQAQIAYLYNRGAPIAWYKLDECSGSTGNNSSVNANGTPAGLNATINIGGTGTYTTTGVCGSGTSTESWNGGTTGKYNSALALDGTNDYADVADNSVLRFNSSTQDFSVFAWVKRAANGTMNVVSKEDAANDGWRLQFNASNQVICSLNSTTITSSSTITDTNWHHIGCTVNRSGTGQVYIDGQPNGSTTATSAITMATTAVLRLGAQSYSITNYLNGLLDDVRIYNYALTAAQVKIVYNQGSAVQFAPLTGSP